MNRLAAAANVQQYFRDMQLSEKSGVIATVPLQMTRHISEQAWHGLLRYLAATKLTVTYKYYNNVDRTSN